MPRKILLLAVLALASASLAQQPLIRQPGIVSPDWLTTKLSAKSLRILDARDLPSYISTHLPGAVYLNIETLRYARGGVPARWHTNKVLAQIFGNLGISRNTDVVVYSSASDNFASSAFIASVLMSMGHRRVAVLDGGYEGWLERSTVSGSPWITTRKFPEPAKLSGVVDASFIRQQGANIQVFDARESKLYEAGHIPKAKNLALASLLTTSGTKKWLPKAEILQRLRAAGYVEGKPVVTYCTTGREGSMLAFTLKHVAGIKNVRLYDGSMLDWRARNLPIEKGTGSLVFGRRSEQTKAIR